MSVSTAIFLALAAGFAGFVDAMVGGGGLVQLPALLIGISDKPIPMILGTNKVPAIFGTSTAAFTYFKKVRPDLRLTVTMALPAFIGSISGARLAASFPKDLFRPIIVLLLIAVAIYTWRKPHLGMDENLRFTHTSRLWLVALFGLTIGFYDGIFGPGTGTFLVFLLVGVVGYAFLKASATAKLVNIATNFGAILSFQFTGHIWWRLGLLLAIANVTGALIGSRLAIRGGSPLVRKVFLVVTTLLIAKVGYDWWASK
ncbi:MAG: TSUP family transporter [Actinomycetes bacterium]